MGSYAEAGVNVSLGDQASRILYDAARETWSSRQGRLGEVLVPFDDFSGLCAIDVSSLPPGTWMMLGFDGSAPRSRSLSIWINTTPSPSTCWRWSVTTQ